MRSTLSKFTALAAASFMIFGLFAVPAASAQTGYPSSTDDVSAPSACTIIAPSISIQGTEVVGSHSIAADACITTITIAVNPVLYSGPPSVTGVIRVPLPALAGDDHTATITATYSDGSSDQSADVTISADALAAARGSVPAAPPLAVATGGLAVTGSSASLPVAIGATLIGAGGLALLVARKRETAAA